MTTFFGIFVQVLLGLALFYVVGAGLEGLTFAYALACLASVIGFSVAERSALRGFLFGLLFLVVALIITMVETAARGSSSWEIEQMAAIGVFSGSIECVIGAITGRIARRRSRSLTDAPNSRGAVGEASDIKIQLGDEQTPIGTSSEEGASSVICPVCQSGFVSGQKTITCPKCNVKHHKECWKLIGGCSTFGCKGS